jgi:hypothetical protein
MVVSATESSRIATPPRSGPVPFETIAVEASSMVMLVVRRFGTDFTQIFSNGENQVKDLSTRLNAACGQSECRGREELRKYGREGNAPREFPTFQQRAQRHG